MFKIIFALAMLYILVVNIVAFAMMGIDKKRAKKHLWRIPEATLFASAFLGGSLGSIFGMQIFHHKTKHWYFKYGMPAILILQLTLSLLIGFLILAPLA